MKLPPFAVLFDFCLCIMEDNGAGPSRARKRVITFKDPKGLAENELSAVLEDSDIELDEQLIGDSSDDDEFQPGDQSGTEESSDDDDGKKLCFCFFLFSIIHFCFKNRFATTNPNA